MFFGIAAIAASNGMNIPRVVIVGCGFGGVYVARHLLNYAERGLCHLTLINRTNYFLFTPLLHEVATGGLSLRTAAEPLREVFRNSYTKIVQGEVKKIDIPEKVVRTDEQEIPFDYLVIATGAETDFYGIPGAREYTLPLKNLSEAGKIRDRIIDSFEAALASNDLEEKKKLLSFVVVGGGATGVEVAGELSDIVFHTMPRYYNTDSNVSRSSSITLIAAEKELLHRFNPRLRGIAKKVLEETGVSVRLNEEVSEVFPDGVRTKKGEMIRAGTVIWLAGVKARIPEVNGPIKKHPSGRILVDAYLRAEDHMNIFAVGDAAAYTRQGESAPLPMFAQIAVREAENIAENIKRSLRGKGVIPFVYKPQGDLVSLGQWFAIGDPYGFTIKGRFAWWLWRTVYLFKFLSRKKKIRIAVEWTINLFYPRDITKFS